MRVVKTYYMRKHRYQHSLALMVTRGHKWTTCIFLEYPLTIEKVLNRDADQFKDAYHSIIPDDPQVSKVARALRLLQRMAFITYKKKSAMPKNLKEIIF